MAQQQLQRLLGKGFSIAACVGLIVGLGILRTPGEIAATISDPVIYMALWIGAGIFILLNILFIAELIAMTPKSGGTYALIAHAYGSYPGFLIGWTEWLSTCSSAALKAVVLLEYFVLLAPGVEPYITPGAVLLSCLFALLQIGGVRLSGAVYQLAAGVFGVILLVMTASIAYAGIGNSGSIDFVPATVRSTTNIGHYGLVAAAIVYTYDGWIAASYFGAEIKGGGRAVATGSIKGVFIVFGLYVLLNGVLCFSLPLIALAGHDLALAGAMKLLLGPAAGTLIVWAAIFILLAHLNTHYMIGTRILYALSVDGLGNQRATSVSEKGTPTGALVFTWALVVSLILAGGFEFLLNMAALLFIVTYLALIIGVFRLRYTEPDTARPFQAWGFPFTGIMSGLLWLIIAIFIGVTNPESALYGLAIIVISIPAFIWLKSRHKLTTL